MRYLLELIVVFIVGTIVVLVLFFLVIAIITGLKLSSAGVGTHSGYVTAVDQRGYVYQNYAVYFKSDNSSSQEDVYCIYREDQDLVDKAIEANKNRELVTIKYKGIRGFGYSICDGSQIIDFE